ncbi:MAG: DUF6340 family protein [Crocinitomicaceae bacterium]
MKRIYFLSFFALLFVVTSCKHQVYLTISDPPIVFLEKEYETAGVINRTFSSGAGKVVDIVDNALSLEGKLDETGSNAAAQGMFDELTTNKRFTYVALLDSMTLDNRAADIFPAPMDWNEVQQICDANGVQVLFVLEVFDTDTKVNYDMQMVNQNTPLGSVQVPRHRATSTTRITTGWRIYDPKNKIIRDEYFVRDRISKTGSGINPVKALSAIMGRDQIVKNLSTQMGRAYASRVRRQYFRVYRDYYNKGSRNLKIARRRADLNDWDGAAELWLKDTESPKRKVAGRACHNMAVYSEIQGDVYAAQEWAQKAYVDYNIKYSKKYGQILSNRVYRIERNNRLEQNDNQN